MHFHDEAEHDDVPFRFEGAPGRGHQIVVTAEKREWLAGRWEHQWRRLPTGEELGRQPVVQRRILLLLKKLDPETSISFRVLPPDYPRTNLSTSPESLSTSPEFLSTSSRNAYPHPLGILIHMPRNMQQRL